MAGYIGSKVPAFIADVESASGDFAVGSDATVSGNVGIGTSSIDGRLTLKNPASSGDQNIVTVQNSSGTNAVGKIVYNQTDDSLKIINASTFSGSHMDFWTGNTERMRIDASGRVTKPYQPSFFASGNQGFQTTASGGTIVLDTTSFNVGSHYSTSTGRFTAPVAGKYFVSFTSYTQSTGTITLKKNGSDFTVTDVAFLYLPNNVSARSGGISGLIHLNANDYMHFGARNNQQVYYYQGHTTFSAFLIG
jgi:hypothetical protein